MSRKVGHVKSPTKSRAKSWKEDPGISNKAGFGKYIVRGGGGGGADGTMPPHHHSESLLLLLFGKERYEKYT